MERRDVLRLGLAAGGSGLLVTGRALAALSPSQYQALAREWTRFLCPPDDVPRELASLPASAPARAFVTPLFVPPVMQPLPGALDPAPVPGAHQRYEDFLPRRFFEIYEKEFQWIYHAEAPYSNRDPQTGARGSWSWGFEGRDYRSGLPLDNGPLAGRGPSTPGPTYHARYGEPVLVRLFNDLPTVGNSKATFALPSTTIHLHNGHTASESDGNPQDWVQPGEFWDHHYANYPSGGDDREKLTTLWYHDHRLDFTAANVYAGLAGFYLLFDELDTGRETDPPPAWGLPSGEFDIPLIIQDIRFSNPRAENPKVRRPEDLPPPQAIFEQWNTDGMLGDTFTVNRRISPFHPVRQRRYRLRILNGGPSRFYQVYMYLSDRVGSEWNQGRLEPETFVAVSGDGNMLPEPVVAESIYLSVAQRVDVIVDFQDIKKRHPWCRSVNIVNRLEQNNGAGPSGRHYEERTAHPLVQFRIEGGPVEDPSRVPDYFRPLPSVDMSEVKRQRLWVFDYDGGLWTINGRVMDPNRIDAGIDQDSAEIWTIRNGGNDWSHPIHSHFTEFLFVEINGKPYKASHIQDLHGRDMTYQEYLGLPPGERGPVRVFMGGPRRDVATLLPGDELKVFMRWKDFLGKHVMHCHNVVHEDHAMMIRWDIMEPGRGFDEPREAAEVYGEESYEPPFPDDRPPSLPHLENRPPASNIEDG